MVDSTRSPKSKLQNENVFFFSFMNESQKLRGQAFQR